MATRRLRYQVASSLDGFIAGPNGEYDWIPMDPDIDFAALFAQFDTLLMGRGTWESMQASGQASGATVFGKPAVVCSTTMTATPTGPRVISRLGDEVRALKATGGKDIWLFGGGRLLRSLLDERLVDTVELAVVPVLLGEGIPVMAGPLRKTTLALTRHHIYQKSGIALMEYSVES
jgi:dihydrofolate reductase